MVFLWILVAILVGIIILGVLAVFVVKNKGKKHEPDYYTFFIMGLIWVAFGIVFRDMSFFFIMGLAFMAIGLVNKDKWKKNHRTWKDKDSLEKKLFLIVMIILLVLVLAGLVAFLIVS